jgi:ATP-dependent helicase/nuclease subunit A
VEVYARDTTDAWRVEALTRPVNGKQVLAALDGANGKLSDEAARAIGRLESKYLYEKLTRIPAIKPVTELKGQLDWADDGDEGPCHAGSGDLLKIHSGHFGVPRQLRPVGTGDAARQKGTATHLFLEKVDLAGPTDRKALARQLERLVERRLLSEVEAGLIDLDSIEWFLNDTQLGMTLRAHHATVHRELSFILRLEPERLTTGSGSDDLADCGIVRGVIDVLWTTPEGIEIADFKTDAVEGVELRRRIDLYKDQLRIYALAIQRIWKRPVCRLWLAFLHPRHVEPFQAGVLR